MGTSARTVQDVIDALNAAGLKPYVYHHRCGGSAYIKFREPVGGSLRVSDHPQRARYHYRWNLRFDYTQSECKDTDNGPSFYYPISDLKTMVEDMLLYKSLTAAELS